MTRFVFQESVSLTGPQPVGPQSEVRVSFSFRLQVLEFQVCESYHHICMLEILSTGMEDEVGCEYEQGDPSTGSSERTLEVTTCTF